MPLKISIFYKRQSKCKEAEIPKPFLFDNSKQLSDRLVAAYNSRSDPKSLGLLDNAPLIDYEKLNEDPAHLIEGGTYGFVIKTRYNKRDVAVKTFRKHEQTNEKQERAAFVNEVNVMALVGDHPNIVGLIGYTLDPTSVVMELVDFDDLDRLIHRNLDSNVRAKISEGKVKKRILLGIANGMAQLHEVDVVHGDLKPANVLITADFTAKIADFGMVTITRTSGRRLHPFGTKAYMAPELLEVSRFTRSSVDVYSFGILMNEVIEEERPYIELDGLHEQEIPVCAKTGLRPRIGERTIGDLMGLIEVCWDGTPEKRPTFKKLMSWLEILDVPDSVFLNFYKDCNRRENEKRRHRKSDRKPSSGPKHQPCTCTAHCQIHCWPCVHHRNFIPHVTHFQLKGLSPPVQISCCGQTKKP